MEPDDLYCRGTDTLDLTQESLEVHLQMQGVACKRFRDLGQGKAPVYGKNQFSVVG